MSVDMAEACQAMRLPSMYVLLTVSCPFGELRVEVAVGDWRGLRATGNGQRAPVAPDLLDWIRAY